MSRETVEPTLDEYGAEVHPAYGMIGASRVSGNAALFDSDIVHQHFVVLRIGRASRRRDLNRDWVHESGGRGQVVEVAMSEAQWASMISSMNTAGVPCTIVRTEKDGDVAGLVFDPRLAVSHAEVRSAADKALAEIADAMAAYEAHKTAANLRTLHYAIKNGPANMEFAATSLTEHAENVVQKARVDIESMVVAKAQQMGLGPDEVDRMIAATQEQPPAIEAPDDL